MSLKFTIFGSKGFIGSKLVEYLTSQGIECDTPDIHDETIYRRSLGHVIYAIGITSDFRERPFDTVKSHVCLLNDFFKKSNFDSFLYLSSTRIYSNSTSTNEENSLHVNPANFSDLYNISKIMGESICLSFKNSNIRIARLSNVVGKNIESNDFLFSIIKDAVFKKNIKLCTDPNSEKDYIYVDDVVKILPRISQNGDYRIYNVGSGKNTAVKDIVYELKKITGCSVNFDTNSKLHSFPEISINRVIDEFDFNPSELLSKIKEIVSMCKN